MSRIPDQNTMHGKELSEAVHAGRVDAVPGDDDAHAHSHAAHLKAQGDVHSKPEGNLRQGSEPGALRQPPQDQGRSGKAHRGQ